MGTRLIIKNANFNKVAINIPMIVEVAANQTITVNNIEYTAGEVDTIFEFKDAINMTKQYNKIKSIKYSVPQIGSANDPLNNSYFGNFGSTNGITEKVDISSCDKVYLSQYAFYNNSVKTFKGFEKVVLGIKSLHTMLHASYVNHKLICGTLIEGTSFKDLFYNCKNVPEIDCSSINIITNCNSMFSNEGALISKLHTINFANADFSNIDVSNTTLYENMFRGAENLTKIIVTNCNTLSKKFLIDRLKDDGFTFKESESGVLTKTI